MMDSTEKIRDMIKLLTMNDDHFHYELASLAAKVNNFLNDRTRVLSGQLLSVMYDSLTQKSE
ncbi:MAG: hypothetical protein JSU58_04390 [Dehalococcoidales bacterium]|nr:MAG: hypothetical protein JSU58_04390 [Dehalococcoidales bacterium]